VHELGLLPDLLYRITHTDMVDNLFVVGFATLKGGELPQYVTASITGDLDEEIDYKKALFKRIAMEADAEAPGKVDFMYPVPDVFKSRFVEKPPFVSPALAADFQKGGGFRYCGAIIPVEKIPEAWKKGIEIAHRHGMDFTTGIQILGYCHSANFCFVYPFNRAKEEKVERVRHAMRDTNEAVLELGGIPWKAEVAAQRKIVEKMDPNTYELINRIRRVVDPNGIMNPGNWSK
jgi:FAD/FMN-containing dehydrogenase